MNEQSRKWTNRTCAVSAMKMPPKTWATLNNPKHPLTIVRVAGGEDVIAAVWGAKVSEDRPNATLIAEAGTVANETGLTPRQLAERVVELEGLLRRIVTEDDNCELDQTTIEIARAALRTINIS